MAVSESTAAQLDEMTANEILRVERDRVIDVTLRHARDEGYCNAVKGFLAKVYPDVTDGFFDSEGLDCDGETREQAAARRAREEEQRRIYEEQRRSQDARDDMRYRVRNAEHITKCWCGEVHS